MEIYTLTTLYIITMELFLTLSILKIMHLSTLNHTNIKYAKFVFFTWFILVVIFFGSIHILPKNLTSEGLFAIILIGIAFSGIVFYSFREIFISLPQELLLLPQAFRMFFGAGFLIEAIYGIIPLSYGVIDGVLHITTAFLATTLAIYIARGCQCTKSLVLVNLFGLLDIVIVAGGIAFIILENIGTEHNVFLAVFFAAPIFIYLHLISLYKVYHDNEA